MAFQTQAHWFLVRKCKYSGLTDSQDKNCITTEFQSSREGMHHFLCVFYEPDKTYLDKLSYHEFSWGKQDRKYIF